MSGDRCVRLGLWSVSGGHKTDHKTSSYKTSSCDRAYKFCDSLAGRQDFDVRFDVSFDVRFI